MHGKRLYNHQLVAFPINTKLCHITIYPDHDILVCACTITLTQLKICINYLSVLSDHCLTPKMITNDGKIGYYNDDEIPLLFCTLKYCLVSCLRKCEVHSAKMTKKLKFSFFWQFLCSVLLTVIETSSNQCQQDWCSPVCSGLFEYVTPTGVISHA